MKSMTATLPPFDETQILMLSYVLLERVDSSILVTSSTEPSIVRVLLHSPTFVTTWQCTFGNSVGIIGMVSPHFKLTGLSGLIVKLGLSIYKLPHPSSSLSKTGIATHLQR